MTEVVPGQSKKIKPIWEPAVKRQEERLKAAPVKVPATRLPLPKHVLFDPATCRGVNRGIPEAMVFACRLLCAYAYQMGDADETELPNPYTRRDLERCVLGIKHKYDLRKDEPPKWWHDLLDLTLGRNGLKRRKATDEEIDTEVLRAVANGTPIGPRIDRDVALALKEFGKLCSERKVERRRQAKRLAGKPGAPKRGLK